ncbi:MAG TPA: BatA domain-containing protein, partial [Actinomycetota bacterium]|nr:BatA domain-containing protein [Actinomycetota bacterium]
MSFITPWVLWLLLLVPLLAGLYVAVQGRRKSYAVRFTN